MLDAYERECAEREADFSQKIKKEDAPEGDAPAFPRARAPDWVTSAYVEYMRCCRRVEGAASARKAFMRARKAPGLGERPEVYACSAQLEWRYDGNDKPARNVFELGLKKCIGDPAYVETYAEFLVGLNDVANARVLYERATAAALEACAGNQALGANAGLKNSLLRVDPAERARREETLEMLFDAFAAFEHHHGSLDAMASVEARRHAALGEVGGGTDAAPAMLTALMRRHSVPGPESRHGGAGEALRAAGRGVCDVGVGAERRRGARAERPGAARAAAHPAAQAAAAQEGRGAPRCGGGGGGGAGTGAQSAPAAPQLPKAPRPGNIPKLMPPPPAPGSAAAAAANLARMLPAELGGVRFALPAAGAAVDAPPHVVDAVMDALMTADLSPRAARRRWRRATTRRASAGFPARTNAKRAPELLPELLPEPELLRDRSPRVRINRPRWTCSACARRSRRGRTTRSSSR